MPRGRQTEREREGEVGIIGVSWAVMARESMKVDWRGTGEDDLGVCASLEFMSRLYSWVLFSAVWISKSYNSGSFKQRTYSKNKYIKRNL